MFGFMKKKKNNYRFKRVFLLVMDSVGVGEAKDASYFNDIGANTLKHTIINNNYEYKNLESLGLINVVDNINRPVSAYYTKAKEVSNGKDTLTGHLEMMGIITKEPFKTFTNNGFPSELIELIENCSGRKVIGNISASGTEIIEKFGAYQISTGALIVYTSADSVLQIAAHEEIIPLDELYKICEMVRHITLDDKYKVGRIIARPFIGTSGNFVRTGNRRDYALDPVSDTVLDNLKNNGLDVISIGKISDIFNKCGITSDNHTSDNIDGINTYMRKIHEDFTGLCFINLNDFDSKYGHRRDVLGYGKCLKELDDKIPQMIESLNDDDLFIITADHGNDPTFRGTDHTREDVPVLIYSKSFTSSGRIGELSTFADIGSTIADNFKVSNVYGTSFLDKLK